MMPHYGLANTYPSFTHISAFHFRYVAMRGFLFMTASLDVALPILRYRNMIFAMGYVAASLILDIFSKHHR